MNKRTHNIIEQLAGPPEERRKAIQDLASDAELKMKILRVIQYKGATKEEAIMIYHDSIMAFVKSCVKRQSSDSIKNVNQYIMGIAKYKWYDTLKEKSSHRTESIEHVLEVQIEDHFFNRVLRSERASSLHRILSQMKRNCKEVLLYWASGYSMKEIAAKLDYKNEGVSRKKKSECLKQVIEYLENNPQLKEIIKP